MTDKMEISQYVLDYLKAVAKGQKVYFISPRGSNGQVNKVAHEVCITDLEKLKQYRDLFEKIKNSDPTLQYSGAELIHYFNEIEGIVEENEDLDYQRHVEEAEYNTKYEPTYNPEDGSM